MTSAARSVLVSLALLGTMSCAATRASAQARGASAACNAAMCEDESAVIAAVEAALEATKFCENVPLFVLATLHPAPYTAFNDAVRARALRNGLPSSPATLRLEDIGIVSTRRFGLAVTIVDSLEVIQRPAERGCLVVASPPEARAGGETRVVVGITDFGRGQAVQRFIFLRRDGAYWKVSRHEVGYQS